MGHTSTLLRQLRRPKATLALFVYASVIGAFVFSRLSLIQASNNDIWSDTDDYLRMAQGPLFSIRFWAGTRPFSVPLIYKLLGADQQHIIYFQFLLALICWTVLGLAIIRHLRSFWLRPFAFAAILLFSLSRDIVQWDLIILTESIASSLFALVIGIWLFAIAIYRAEGQVFRKRLTLCLLITTTALWSFTRDTNAYFVLGSIGLLAAGLLFTGIRNNQYIRHYIILIIAFMAIFVAQSRSADVYGRWRYPLMNIIGKRILVNKERTTFFAASGMPTDERVMRFKNNYAHAYGNAVFHDQDMEYFRQWMDTRGKQTYLLFLASHPLESLAEPLQKLNILLRPPIGYYGDRAGLSFPTWVLVLTGILYPRAVDMLLSCAGVLVLVTLVLVVLRRSHPEWVVPGVLLLLTYPMMLIVWHGDAIEVERHSFLVGVQLRLGCWLLLVLIIDALVSWMSQRPSHAADMLL